MEEKNRSRDLDALIKDPNKSDYNCGGFALGTYDWELPYSDDNEWETTYEKYETICKELERELTEVTTDFLCDTRVRLIKNESELKPCEYLVLYRVGAECDDFHFLRRSDDGDWYHKIGEGNISKFEDDPYDIWECGVLVYDGPIQKLAVRRD